MIVGEVKQVHVTQHNVRRPDFGDACTDAYRRALLEFGINEDGHSEKVDFVRSTDSIVVKFEEFRMSGGMGGQEYTFTFKAAIERCDEDEEEG
jgi:hypothetical protein